MRILPSHSMSCMVCLLLTGAGLFWTTMAYAAPERPLRLVELFTSHGCSSCPPADRLLGEMLQEDESLMALEYHVDYWDSLVHGSDGSWKDPFAKPAYTQRQQAYSAAGLSGRNGVYTPQVVVNGRYVGVGSNERHLRQALEQPVPAQLQFTLEASSGADPGGPGELDIRVDADESQLQGAVISLVRYIDQASTDITGGENNHRQLVNHHIVFDVVLLAEPGLQSPMQYRVEAPDEGEGCIVMVQDVTLSRLLGAAECP